MFKYPVSTAFDTYTVGKLIGEGGSGAVYEATNLAGELVALKCLKSALTHSKRKRFKNEVLFGQRHQHPNIVPVVDSGAASDGNNTISFYVMPRYPNTLRHLIEKGIPAPQVLPRFSQLLDGVEAAHMLGVNHRDLKPENVLCDERSKTLVVADFGAAEFTEDQLYTVVETKPAERIANFQYAAPEQKIRGGAVDHRADIFALGLILNEMYTGEVPSGTAPLMIAAASPEHAYLDDLAGLMMRQHPGERPGTIADVKRQIAGRANEFIAFQRLNALKTAVVPMTSPDVPAPVEIADVDFKGDDIVFVFNPRPSGDWISVFQNLGNYTSLLGRGPQLVRFVSNTGIFQARAHEIEPAVQYFKQWVDAANKTLPGLLAEKARQHDGAVREQIKKAMAAEEARLSALQRARKALG